jgi:hypothetical protein
MTACRVGLTPVAKRATRIPTGRGCWTRPFAASRPDIAEFLPAAERYHLADEAGFARDAAVPQEVRRAYHPLGVLAGDNETSAARADLDQIDSDLDRAAALFGPMVSELAATGRAQRTEVEAVRQELTATRAAQRERSKKRGRPRGGRGRGPPSGADRAPAISVRPLLDPRRGTDTHGTPAHHGLHNDAPQEGADGSLALRTPRWLKSCLIATPYDVTDNTCPFGNGPTASARLRS